MTSATVMVEPFMSELLVFTPWLSFEPAPRVLLAHLVLFATLAGEVRAKSIGVEARVSKKTILSRHERPANPLFRFDARRQALAIW
jgi:hypothetical protein